MIRKTPKEGFTLLELLVAVVVIAIIVAVGIPSFQTMIDRNRLRAVTEELFVDLNYARSESIKQNRIVAVYFNSTSTSWCYGIDDNLVTACDCATAPANCTVNGLPKVVSNTDHPSVALNLIQFTDNVVGFDPRRGMPVEGSALNTPLAATRGVGFQSALGKNRRVELGILGRPTTVYP
jgi:prepilin-type N-terminal cleavage/methylation domain-containing protein